MFEITQVAGQSALSMQTLGKILFFNADTGQGIIITSDKKKTHFGVEEWDDYDTMPSLGLEVSFIYEKND